MSKRFKGGIILIIAGVFMLLNQLGLIPGQMFIFLLAFGFIATYVLLGATKEYKNVGFLIPGCVLMAIGLYASAPEITGQVNLNPAFFFLALSLSFLAVFSVHTFWFKSSDHGGRFWPLYPSAGLILLAIIIGLGTTGLLVENLGLFNYIWIIALIVTGVWLIVSSLKKGKG